MLQYTETPSLDSAALFAPAALRRIDHRHVSWAGALSEEVLRSPLRRSGADRRTLTIGVLDSGVGGLTVVKQILRQMPSASIRYLGDNARCPYGVRPQEEIRYFTWQLIDYLRRQPLDALVIACNTATAVVLDEAQRHLPFPVLGVIQPGVEEATSNLQVKRVALLATPAAVRSGAHVRAIKAIRPELDVMSLACPEFVTLVETGRYDTPEAYRTIDALLTPVRDFAPDALILGCTHFPLLKEAIQRSLGSHTHLIDPAEATARELKGCLASTGIYSSPLLSPTRHTFFTTGSRLSFRQIGEHWLERNITVKGCRLTPPSGLPLQQLQP